ncbi:hypothetical protein H310_10281 [Aphanomyces invadans]|uniref:Peptidase n=1 Tax=Aphanomyces invadans TaxID=157072 RepID=A0A024TQZ3_9STRA|nr:hypothetical protein H310_10281 [Aphanomyces invadans]ETV96580.1 hypothetical protein H310_10281 [Aphanomyces invadans]|eukprot:XP_008874843.1 hypothetical protein H310_10281 [Aphanomyces invadans]
MRIAIAIVAIACASVAGRFVDPEKCTAILVGAKASATGSPMTTQTNDCADCDFRLVKVPAKDHVPGSVRPVILVGQPYPRYVGEDRGPTYSKANLDKSLFNWTDTKAIGSIPQVNHTYGYVEGVYGIMNEHQLGIGESTCGAKLWTKPVSHGGKALLDITELGRIALERTKTAKEAILLMGRLAEQYGYYGASWDSADGAMDEAGEALTVADPKEGWMFHILPDDSGTSAVWVAQRVPDNHITAIANQFVIRHINLTDSDNFLGSSNIFDVAIRNAFWDSTTPFDFTAAYALRESNPYTMTRRVWRILSLANSTIDLSPFTDAIATNYPFSVQTDRPVTPADLMRFQRDHYEGTPFDLTQGLAAGPYGDPNRFSPGHVVPGGSFERSISIYKATYSYVTTAHPTNENQAVVWFGPYAPSDTAYFPIYPKVSAVPDVASRGSLHAFDMSAAFWLNALIGNYASRYYKFTQPVVRAEQLRIEAKALEAQPAIHDKALSIFQSQGDEALETYLTNVCTSFAADAHSSFTALFSSLVTQFHDGYIMSNLTGQEIGVTAMGYPPWWLDAVGYYNATRGPPTMNSGSAFLAVLGYVVLVFLALAVGFVVGQRAARSKGYAYIK